MTILLFGFFCGLGLVLGFFETLWSTREVLED